MYTYLVINLPFPSHLGDIHFPSLLRGLEGNIHEKSGGSECLYNHHTPLEKGNLS